MRLKAHLQGEMTQMVRDWGLPANEKEGVGVGKMMKGISLGWVAVMSVIFVLTAGVCEVNAWEDTCGGFISCGNVYDCCNNGTDEEDGNCTWWAWKMMADRWGYRAPSWGNAGLSWLTGAKNAQLPTGDTPRVGSIFVRSGHVGYVVQVGGSTIYATEMNCGYKTQYTSETSNMKVYTDAGFLGFIYPPDGSGPVPGSGVSKCYDASGNVIICPGPGKDFYGQDGNFNNQLSYTKMDASGNDLPASASSWAMVRDNVTKLVWEVKTDDGSIRDKDNKYTWYDAWDTFIYGLNDAKFGGYCDWRLPTIKELAYLVDYSIPYPGPTINTKYFPNTVSSYYWSSTANAYRTYWAWYVCFGSGGGLRIYKTYDYYVRAVRGGQ